LSPHRSIDFAYVEWTAGIALDTIRRDTTVPDNTMPTGNLRHLLFLISVLLLYLSFWPVDIRPRVWTPLPMPALDSGVYAANDRLRSVQRFMEDEIGGPEDIVADAEGRLYTGLADGRIFSISADGSECRMLGNTGGRPLGVAHEPDGSILVADASKGLLRLRPDGETEVLGTAADGIKFGFTDDLVRASDGMVYLTDASFKFGYGHHMEDLLEHGGNGRLLRYRDGTMDTLMAGLHFANGVTLGPNEDYVLVAESSEYKITRYWLRGEKAATSEPFIENLPGYPDNINFNGRDRFWIALFSPRDPILDSILPGTFLRTVVARLPRFLQPGPGHHAFVLGLDLQGRVVENYQFDDVSAYAPITSVYESQGWLYLGSLTQKAVGRIKLDDLRGSGAAAEPPPPVRTSCTPASP
jgi:sugar lactone lactonase YvrE